MTGGSFAISSDDAGLIDPNGALSARTGDACSLAMDPQVRDQRLQPIGENYTAHQFGGDNLVMGLSSALRRAGLPPSTLRVEITESILIEDDPDILKLLNQIRKLGMHLAIDDFGIARSSIRCLRSLPINFLKVDRSFVSGASMASRELSLTRSTNTIANEAGEGDRLPSRSGILLLAAGYSADDRVPVYGRSAPVRMDSRVVEVGSGSRI